MSPEEIDKSWSTVSRLNVCQPSAETFPHRFRAALLFDAKLESTVLNRFLRRLVRSSAPISSIANITDLEYK